MRRRKVGIAIGVGILLLIVAALTIHPGVRAPFRFLAEPGVEKVGDNVRTNLIFPPNTYLWTRAYVIDASADSLAKVDAEMTSGGFTSRLVVSMAVKIYTGATEAKGNVFISSQPQVFTEFKPTSPLPSGKIYCLYMRTGPNTLWGRTRLFLERGILSSSR